MGVGWGTYVRMYVHMYIRTYVQLMYGLMLSLMGGGYRYVRVLIRTYIRTYVVIVVYLRMFNTNVSCCLYVHAYLNTLLSEIPAALL